VDRWIPQEVSDHIQFMNDFAARLEGTGEFVDVEGQERAVELTGELSSAPGDGGRPIHEWIEVRPFLETAPPADE
jgi:hypothetical protein